MFAMASLAYTSLYSVMVFCTLAFRGGGLYPYEVIVVLSVSFWLTQFVVGRSVVVIIVENNET